ncbi:MAG: GlxA family transcriptional regulator [Escherichia sp.]
MGQPLFAHSGHSALFSSRRCRSGNVNHHLAENTVSQARKIAPFLIRPVDLFCKKITFQDMKKILIIVPDGGMLFESAGIAVLMQANRLHPEDASGSVTSTAGGDSTASGDHGQSGLNLLADHRLHEIDPRDPLDTIIITGRGQNPQEGIAVVDWLRLAAPHARRIASICGGAMLLAQTGLLDGRRATTHWKLLETMQAEFPLVRVEGGPLYIQDEHIWTSGGVSSGFDLTLALVEEDYGFSLARDIAQDFVMYLRRPGGQLQFSRYNLQQTTTWPD